MVVLSLPAYRRRRELRDAAVRVGLVPQEHPSATMRRDRADGAGRGPVSFPSYWDCPNCRTAVPLVLTSCATCGIRRPSPWVRR